MDLPDTGEIVTPVDDPSQFNPAWRAIVAGYLFSVGVRTDEDLDSIAKTGCLPVPVRPWDDSGDSGSDSGAGDASTPAKGKGNPRKGAKDAKAPRGKGRKGAGEAQGEGRPEGDPEGGGAPRKYLRRITPFYECAEYRPMATDRWIRAQIALTEEEATGKCLSDGSVPLRLASRWYSEMECESAMRKRLEPLLLTEIGVDVITLDLIGAPSAQPAIEAYEKLYYNCRDENFGRMPSMQHLQRMATPYGPLKMFLRKWEDVDADGFVIGDGRPIARDSDVWRAVAVTMGYETLMYLWRWDRVAHGIKDRSLSRMLEISWSVAASRLMSDLFSGDISHEDTAKVLAAFTSQSKFISDASTGRGGGDESSVTKALMAVLYQTSPKMVTVDAEDESSRNSEIQSRIQSQLAISRQAIDDKGKSVEREIVDAQISNAVRPDNG